MTAKIFTTILLILSSLIIFSQESYRHGLFFREDWKETPPEIPLSKNHVKKN